MVNYINEITKEIRTVVGKVPVTTTYPDTDIEPIIIVRESSQSEIFICSEYEHVSSTILLEIYASDPSVRQNLKNQIDPLMRRFLFDLTKKEDVDNGTIYKCAMTYDCEVIDRKNGTIEIYKPS